MSQAFINEIFETVVLPHASAIQIETVRAGLSGVLFDSTPSLSLPQWRDLIFAGSVLAQSDDPKHLETALGIATCAIIAQEDRLVREGGAVLLDQLGNSRAQSLAEQRGFIQPNLEGRLGAQMMIDTIRRDVENSVLIRHSGERLPANSFQRNLWNRASEPSIWVSASAPTAAGKTYIVGALLHDKILSKGFKRILYLAPTRALVGEVQRDLKERFKSEPSVQISSMPLPSAYEQASEHDSAVIYVLTQERIHLLVNALGGETSFDLLVVDEAQKISDRRRGVILQGAIDRIVTIEPNIQVILISPSTSNPEVLLNDKPRLVDGSIVDSSTPMVLQNIVTVQQKRGKNFSIGLLVENKIQTIGSITLSSLPSSFKKRVAFIAAEIGVEGGTLVYVTGAAEAEDVAQLIRDYQMSSDSPDPHPDLIALSELIRRGVHPQYALAELVLSGVGFHYGNMPALVRAETERLFSTGRLKFLVCTSTLIEGVNLSCKNIVVRDPHKGKSTPMSPHDFWNLAGRAGRWGTEFQGNIICIDPFEGAAWKNGIPERTLYEIQPERDASLGQQEQFTDYVKNMSHVSEAEDNDDLSKIFAPVASSLLSKFLVGGALSSTALSDRYSTEYLNDLDHEFEALSERVKLPSEILERHPGLNPIGLQGLLENFQAYDKDPANLQILRVGDDRVFFRLETIFNRITSAMGSAFGTEKQARLYAVIVLKWLQGMTLPRIIDDRIKNSKERGSSSSIAYIIRDTLDLVQNIARFNAPRYLSAYEDVLNFHLLNVDRSDLIDDSLDIGTALEFGVSSRTLLSLMSIGLSRMTAVEIFDKIADDELNEDHALAWIRNRSSEFEGMGLPALMIKELREVALIEVESSDSEVEDG